MADYISRDYAIQCACELLIINGGCTRCSEEKKVCSSVREAFAIIPAADVVDADECERAYAEGWKNGEEAAEGRRKKGKWKTAYLDHEAFGIRPQAWYCSECQQITSFRTFYCPNCGADMRGVTDEES